ncbi:MAG: nucleotidyltransferase family protein [Patescibacteria group bacterium]
MTNKGRFRLTITLRKDLLPLLDQTIDGAKIRNRSHAIEYLLGQALGPKIKKAVILAGGKGIKMRPLTYEMPKAMIPVKGKPILEYIVDSLRDSGIKDIIVLIGPLGEKIKEYFGDGSRFGVKIKYVKEKETAGTGGALRQLEKTTGLDSFILVYGDVLVELNYHDLIEFHTSHNGFATVALTSVAEPYEYGAVKLHGENVVDFIEKPEKGSKASHLISSGVYIIEPEVYDYLSKKSPLSLEKDVLPKLIDKKKVLGYPFEGKWFDVSTPEIYEQVLKEWNR